MKRYFMFNKPKGCITACRDARQKTVMDYLDIEDKESLFPIGRLDKDTEGLLLITDDGMLFHNLMKPENKVSKTYFFWAKGTITKEKIKELEKGAAIYPDKTELTAPAALKIVERKTLIEIKHLLSEDESKLTRKKGETPVFSGLLTITEGKKHQVKRMLKYAGCKVVYLKRVAIGALMLDSSLREGSYRPLAEEEILSSIKPYSFASLRESKGLS